MQSIIVMRLQPVYRYLTVLTILLFSLFMDNHNLYASEISSLEIMNRFDEIDGFLTDLIIDLTALHITGKGAEEIHDWESSITVRPSDSLVSYKIKSYEQEGLIGSEIIGEVDLYKELPSFDYCYISGKLEFANNPSFSNIYFFFDKQFNSYVEVDDLDRTAELSEYFLIQSQKYMQISKELFQLN